MLADENSFVKLPHFVLLMDIPAEAKILYCVLSDKISYSKFTDDQGQYYFLTGKERQQLMQVIGCKRETFQKCLRILKEKGLIYSRQHGIGCRFYRLPRLTEKSTTDNSEGGKIDYQLPKKSTTEVGGKTGDLINKTNQNKHKNNTDIDIINGCQIVTPEFYDVLLYWREKHYHSSPAEYYDHYSLNNWQINNEPVRDWKRLADAWEKRQY